MLSKNNISHSYITSWLSLLQLICSGLFCTLLTFNTSSRQRNNFIQTLHAPEGDRFAVLFTYANGRKAHIFPGQTHFQIGEIMAGMHLVTNNRELNRITYSPEVIIVDSLKQVSNFLSTGTEEMDFMESIQISIGRV